MKVKTILAIVLAIVILFFTGCAPSYKQNRAEIIKQEVSRLTRPSQPLSSYNSFKLEAMVFSEEVTGDNKKVAVANQLEEKLRAKLLPLFEEWGVNKAVAESTGTLLIKPRLHSLKVVSSGARFWIGAMAGDSSIDMNLILVDSKTGNKIASARVHRSASAMSGGWSVGATDKNLLNYIVEIVYEYLVENYAD